MTQQEAPLNGDPVVIPAPPPSTGSMKKDTKSVKSEEDPLGDCPVDDFEQVDLREYVKKVSLWTDQVLSAKVFLITALVYYFTYGKEGYSLFTFMTLLVIERTIAVFGLTSIGHLIQTSENGLIKKLGEAFTKAGDTLRDFTQLPSEKSIKYWLGSIGKYLELQIISAVNALKEAEHDVNMLKVVLAHLFAFCVVFWLFSIKTIVFLTLFAGLTIPPVYTRQKEKIDPIIAKAYDVIEPHMETLKVKGNELVAKIGTKLDEAKAQAAVQIEKTKTQVAQKVQTMRNSTESDTKKTK